MVTVFMKSSQGFFLKLKKALPQGCPVLCGGGHSSRGDNVTYRHPIIQRNIHPDADKSFTIAHFLTGHRHTHKENKDNDDKEENV